MVRRVMLFVIVVLFTVPDLNAQRPLPQRTPETDREALRLMRNEKLKLILPGAMGDNGVDMLIHVGRYNGVFANPHSGPLTLYFGRNSGYLIFTDLGDGIERAYFSDSFGFGGIENIDICGSLELSRAIIRYDYHTQDFSVYDEITQFVAERDPKTIEVNTSD